MFTNKMWYRIDKFAKKGFSRTYSSGVIWRRRRRFLLRLSACKEMPVELASDMIAMSFLPLLKSLFGEPSERRISLDQSPICLSTLTYSFSLMLISFSLNSPPSFRFSNLNISVFPFRTTRNFRPVSSATCLGPPSWSIRSSKKALGRSNFRALFDKLFLRSKSSWSFD
jgi:hypothetical protein